MFPDDVVVVEGETVAIVTRQLGLWVLASCRIETVVDEPTGFGFTYATLPDHPECGYESFVVLQEEGTVRFHIEPLQARYPLVRLGAPVTRLLQQRATNAYLDALEQWSQQAA